MRLVPFFVCLLGAASASSLALAQTTEGEGERGEATPASVEEEDTRLRAPQIEPLDLLPETDEEEQDEDSDDAVPGDVVDATGATGGVEQGAGVTASTTWTAPKVTLSLHGYFRARGEWQDTFWLGRLPESGSTLDPPFSAYRPIDSTVTAAGGCGDEPDTTAPSTCDTEALSYANMRLRLMPSVSVSDAVAVHAWIDVFDNLVLGSTPDGYFVEPSGTGLDRGVSATVPLEAFTTTAVPPQHGRNSLNDSIVARRVWAEVTNRDLGRLQFGRMGSHWGLGILANGGAGIDDDYSSDVDRVMAMTRLAGLYWVAAYDFMAEGLLRQSVGDITGPAYDAGQEDDIDQYVLAVARKTAPEEQDELLQNGDVVLNGGLYFVYRTQKLSSEATATPFDYTTPSLVRRGAEAFIPDVWFQLLWRGLRVELEGVMIAGSLESIETAPDSYTNQDYTIFELGAALEAEYKLLDDKLHLYLYSGFASGDQDVEGLTAQGGILAQSTDDDTISTFRFHPSYRVDLILWRTVMRQIAGAYYFKPGIAYDFMSSAFGRLLQARVDLVWSRAAVPVQSWGNADDLGVELDATLTYRSEDGPDLADGFYAMAQYGLLFPMQGLGYLEGQEPAGFSELRNAQTLRLLLGVQW